jgi:ribosomal-protein-alanine N-acetyltransferase
MHNFVGLTIRTQRLLLRPVESADAEAFFGIFSHPVVMRYWSTPPWTSMEQAQVFIERSTQSLESGQNLRLAIVKQVDGSLIGQCTLFGIYPTCRRAEIGYSLAHADWGNGYANEALRALIGYAFDTLNLNRIEADVDPRNTGSAKALRRLGFTKEGYLRERWIVGDEVSDSELYGLLRREWSRADAGDA